MTTDPELDSAVEARIAELRAENEELQTDTDFQRDEITRLRDEIARLREEIAQTATTTDPKPVAAECSGDEGSPYCAVCLRPLGGLTRTVPPHEATADPEPR